MKVSTSGSFEFKNSGAAASLTHEFREGHAVGVVPWYGRSTKAAHRKGHPMSKRAAIAFFAILIVVVGFTGTQAIATQGQPVIAGVSNTATATTWLINTNAIPIGECATTGSGQLALIACGTVFAQADGTDIAVIGDQSSGGTGVLGSAGDGGTGVRGEAPSSTGIGVHGRTPGTGSAVYGEATGPGVGVYGDTTNGTGVIARSTNGTALSVVGKAKFNRSGTIIIPAGAASSTVTMAGVTNASMVLATSQRAAKVFVKSAVPGSGSFTIRLSGLAPAAGLKVAYFVLN
jgi:hypothetical protein